MSLQPRAPYLRRWALLSALARYWSICRLLATRSGVPRPYRLVRLGTFVGTPFQSWALDQAYLLAPRVDFSRAVLQSSLPALAVLRVPALAWCDLGTPERVAKSRQMLG